MSATRDASSPPPVGWPLASAFVLSGAAAVALQVLWSRQLAQSLGGSDLAIAVVLAVFLGGLALGSALSGRYAAAARRPLVLYAALEIGVAAAALSFRPLLGGLERLQVDWFGGLPHLPPATDPRSAFFVLASGALLLLPPTLAMGASLPLLVEVSARRGTAVRGLTTLYTVNCAGAAAGALGTAYWVIPALGLDRAVRVAAGASLLAGIVALALDTARGRPRPAAVRAPAAGRVGWASTALAAFSGFSVLSFEILWTRLLGQALGGSLFAFATLLAGVLLGLAGGAAIAARLARSRSRRDGALAAALAVAATGAIVAFLWLDRLPTLLLAVRGEEGQPFGFAGALLAVLCVLPFSLAAGVVFPLVAARELPDGEGAGRVAGRLLAANTAGAIAGALTTGLWLLPLLGFARLQGLLAALALAFAAALAFRAGAARTAPCLLTAAGLAALLLLRQEPETLLRSSPLAVERDPLVFLGVGRSATVEVVDHGDAHRLLSNGLPESLVHGPGAPLGTLATAHWMGLLASAGAASRPSALFVGLGGGVALEAIPPRVERISVVEIEPEIVAANRFLAPVRARDPLADPRLEIVTNDARDALRRTAREFDAIVSQPSHPWTGSSAALYTREMFDVVARRLAPDGLFVQWMGLAYVDESLLQALLSASSAVFPEILVLAADGQSVLIVAGSGKAPLFERLWRAVERDAAEWASAGVRAPEDLLARVVLDDRGARAFAADARPLSDGDNPLAVSAFARRGAPIRSRVNLERLTAAHDPLASRLAAGAVGSPARLVRELAALGSGERARRLLAASADSEARDVAASFLPGARSADDSESTRRLVAALSARGSADAGDTVSAALVARFLPDLEAGRELGFEGGLGEGARAVAAAIRARVRRSAEEQIAQLPALERVVEPALLAPLARRERVEALLARRAAGDGERAFAVAAGLAEGELPRARDLWLRFDAALAADQRDAALAALSDASRRLAVGALPAAELGAAIERLALVERGGVDRRTRAIRRRLEEGRR